MKIRFFSQIAFALSLFLMTGCNDNQEIFFEDDESDKTIEVVHPDQRDKPYPREEHELYINPAPLLVPRAARAADEFLEFELSQNIDFPAEGTYRSGKLAWNVYNIHEVMESGQWYWRFRKVDKDDRAAGWSKVYSFTVTGKEPVFVTPDFSVLQQNIPVEYPRIHCYIAQDIEKAKATITEHREYKALTDRAKIALEERNLTPTNLYAKTSDLSTYVFDYLYSAYLLTGEQKYYDKILDYGRRMIAQTVDDKTLFENNFQSAEIVNTLNTVYDACQTSLAEDEKTAIEKLILKVVIYYYDAYRGRMENWFFDEHTWQITLRAMLEGAFVTCQEYPEAMTALQYFYELWTSRAPSNGSNRDGAWFNGAGYFETNQYTLYYMPMLFSHLTNVDFLKHPWYQNAGKALVYSWLPESRATSFGDFDRGNWPYRSRVGFADFLARELGDANAIWYVQECQRTIPHGKENDYSLYANVDLRLYRMSQGDAPYDISGTEELEFDNFIWYKDCGEGIAFSNMVERSKNLSLAFRSSPYGSGNHTHSDQNSFKLFYKGENVYMNTGYYQNYSNKHAILQYRNTRGHNTIMINDIGQPFSTAAYGNITRGLNGDNIAYFSGDASQAYCGTTETTYWLKSFAATGLSQTPQYGFGENPLNCYKRQIFMLRPNKVVIYDELGADEPATWQWLLHSPVEFQVEGNKIKTNYPEKGGFTSVAQIFSNCSPKITTTNRWFPGGEPADQDPVKYPKQWHLTAEFEPCARNKILTVIQISDNGNVEEIWQINDEFLVGDWTIKAELDADAPAAISITDKVTGATFSCGYEAPNVDGTLYQRQQEGSSVLYDYVNGTMQIQEMGDKPLQTTRSIR